MSAFCCFSVLILGNCYKVRYRAQVKFKIAGFEMACSLNRAYLLNLLFFWLLLVFSVCMVGCFYCDWLGWESVLLLLEQHGQFCSPRIMDDWIIRILEIWRSLNSTVNAFLLCLSGTCVYLLIIRDTEQQF